MESDPWADTPPVAVSRTATPVDVGLAKLAVEETAPSPILDDGFGEASSPEPATTSPAREADAIEGIEKDENQETEEEAPADDGFDDFDDFDEAGPSQAEPDDEGFGDFGDFEEGDFGEEPQAEAEQETIAEPEVEQWVSRE